MAAEFTVGDLRQQLNGLHDDDEITFAGGLSFYRLKRVGDSAYFMEFNEAEGYRSDDLKKRNPGVKVVFMDPDAADWDEDGLLGVMDVAVR